MSENKQFKDALIEFDKAKKDFVKNRDKFKFDVMDFMKDKGIPVKVMFFTNFFEVAIDYYAINNFDTIPKQIPLDVLSDFCEKFGCVCDFSKCKGHRYFFKFNGLSMGLEY